MSPHLAAPIVGWATTGLLAAVVLMPIATNAHAETERLFEGRFFAGAGDVAYLELLDTARRMFAADPQFQNMTMLYTPAWNGLVEGPTWGAWWIQNSYGTTYCALPFYVEPMTTFLQNAQDLWFNQMGDGKRAGAHDWVAPDGALCDAAAPGWIVYKQGDGRIDIHDWGMEFTAAGLLMQAELLLISRDSAAIEHYLPKLERCANFIETRRDPDTNLFLAGAAGNLLAPSYAGWKKPDGTYDKAYLAGLSITYIAALDRLIEVEKLANRPDEAARYVEFRDRAKAGLPRVTTDEGYFLKSLDPDGTRHGVYGAETHGYFEASPNHDAIAFRVVDDGQARRIYEKIVSIPGLRRHTFIITNEPGLDDMYDPGTSWLWKHGTWVNGGHWSTCEGRMVLGYFRLGQYDDARRSMEKLLEFARAFRMDNPLVEWGSKVYQPKEPINLCYDTFAPAAAMIRGLFEYLYRADGLTLIPHIPSGITRLEQRFPIRFGAKRLFLATAGSGAVKKVWIDDREWTQHDDASIFLPYAEMPEVACVRIVLGDAALEQPWPNAAQPVLALPPTDASCWDLSEAAGAAGGNTLDLRFGADSNGGSRFTGDIGPIVMCNQALDDDAMKALAADWTAKPEHCVAQWTFEEMRKGPYPARFIHSGELVETPKGHAARLDGAGHIRVDHNDALNLVETFTLAAWIRPIAFPDGGARIVDKIPAGRDQGYLLDTHPRDGLRLITPEGTLAYAAALPLDEWTHVAATFASGGALRLYVNGKRVAEGTCGPRSGASSFAKIRALYERLVDAGLESTYVAQHARLTLECVLTVQDRMRLLREGKLESLPELSQGAADQMYLDTAAKLRDGLVAAIEGYADASDADQRKILALWLGVEAGTQAL
ncbi:MAG TPA: hypothetical protein PLO37_10765 [Candidatus Hydrogenedentes bacterium]|nr:hypothetical protein [Candidatus Hydrogenedentota bacterium]HPG67318.1 hypothetical protein [Candidatus Hydrogenedentota bacterium]